jgi:hypothetical protein
VRVRISDPDLLLALCDYLSERGLIAVAATQETADVLVQTAQSDLEAELLVLAALRRWRVERGRASRTTSSRTSAAVGGRLEERCGYVQRRATSSRCQRKTVAGVTKSDRRHARRGSTRLNAATSTRSACVSCGRAT